MPDIEPNDLLEVLQSEKPPNGIYIEGPLVTITGGAHRLVVQVGKKHGRLIPTGFIMGCEDAASEVWRHASSEYSFREIMAYLNKLAIPELKEEAREVKHPGKRGWPDSHYEMIANAYKNRSPGQPMRMLAAQFRVTTRTLYRWLDRARDKGYL